MKLIIEHRKKMIPNFKIAELVPPKVLTELGDNAILLFDTRLLLTIQAIRDNIKKPIYINRNGKFTQRGLRTPESEHFAETRSHALGQGVDFDVEGMSADSVRLHILTNIDKYPYIKGIETGCNWVHVDVQDRYLNQKEVLLFPMKGTIKHESVDEYIKWLQQKIK